VIYREIVNSSQALLTHLKTTVKSSRHSYLPVYTTYRIVEKLLQIKVVYKNEQDYNECLVSGT